MLALQWILHIARKKKDLHKQSLSDSEDNDMEDDDYEDDGLDDYVIDDMDMDMDMDMNGIEDTDLVGVDGVLNLERVNWGHLIVHSLRRDIFDDNVQPGDASTVPSFLPSEVGTRLAQNKQDLMMLELLSKLDINNN